MKKGRCTFHNVVLWPAIFYFSQLPSESLFSYLVPRHKVSQRCSVLEIAQDEAGGENITLISYFLRTLW